MNKTRFVMLVGVLLLSLALVGMALAADNAQKPPPPANPTSMTTSKSAGGQTDSLSGSFVAFDPTAGGDITYIPGMAQTFCFRAESYTNDWNYVYNVWEKFPSDWTVTNVSVVGTPVCDSGGTWGTFSWSFVTPPNEVNINHPRYQAFSDHCVAYYCFDVVSGSGAPDALESWYWAGDDYGAVPHRPCSSDGYTPAGQTACDEAINPPAAIPPGVLDPVMLTPLTQSATGCGGAAHDYFETVWNNTGYDTTIDLSYELVAGSGTCTGPDSVILANGTTTDITINMLPFGDPGTTVQCLVTAVDEQNPENNASALLDYNVISGGLDPAGWALAPNSGAIPAQWQACAVGTNPGAVGEVGYQVGGLDTVGGTQYTLQMYDPHAETWTQLAPAPHNYFGQVAGWLNGKLYIAGGFDATFIGSSDLEVYDPVANTWDNITPTDLPAARGGGAGGVGICHTGVGECLFVVGGDPDSSFINSTLTTYEYDLITNAWTQLDNRPAGDTPDGITLGGGVGCLGKIYQGGDYRGFNNFFVLDPLAPAGTQWTPLADIPGPAGKMTPAMVCLPADNAIYLIGGDSLGYWGDLYNNKVFRYDIIADTWTGPLTQTLNQGLLGSCGTFMAENLYTFGGTNGTNAITPAPHEALAYLTCGPSGPINATKDATDMVLPGDAIDYAITVNNVSPDEIAASMVDPIPAGTTFVPGSVTCTSGECSYDTGLNAVVWAGNVGPAAKSKGIDNIGSSTMNFIDPNFFPEEGATTDLCFNVTVSSPDSEYMDGFDFTLPADWVVNSVTDVPSTGCTFNTHTFGVTPENKVFWYTDGMPTECGNWLNGTYNFCANVTVPAECTAGWDLPWNIFGDTWGVPPHSVSGSALASCGVPAAPNPVTITFQATAGEECPALVTNMATVSTEGFPDVVAAADTNVYCSFAPDIVVDPLSLAAEQPANTITSQQLQICNNGPTPLDWSLAEVPGLKVNSITPAQAPTGAVSHPVALSLEANNIAGPTAPAPAVPNADVSLILDDGTRENDIGLGGTIEMLWVNRFTPNPADFPFYLNEVQIYFSSLGLVNVGDDIVLIFYENTSGNDDPAAGSNFLAAFPTTIQALDQWNVYTLPSNVVFSGPGDAIVGVIGMETPGTSYWPASMDQTATQARSWAGWWDQSPPPDPPILPPPNWTLIDAYFPGNWMVRGFGQTIPQEDIPWLDEVPTSGTVNPFACIFVDVSFNSTSMVPGLYTGVLDVNSNDPDTPVVPVDVSLTVLESPDIAVDPTSLTATLVPNQQETQDLNVCNVGQSPLDWTLTEALGLKVNSITTVPAGAKPSHPVTLALDANGISAPTGPAPKTPNGDIALVLDDGSRDNDIGIGGTQEFIWVNRFTPTPTDFPFQINEVWIYFSSVGLVNVGDDIKIVFYENTTGGFDPAPGSAYLGGFNTTVQALDTWNVYSLADPVWFSGPTGDAIIGVIGLETPGTSYWPASIDQTTTQQRSWAGWWNVMPPPDPPLLPPDASWILIDDYFPGNWMVRGYGESGQDILTWVSETPTAGTVQPGDCAIINVTFDSTDLGLGTYNGFLDIASNDPDEPVVEVPVTLNVVEPDIVVTPTSLALSLFPNETGTVNFTIENVGVGDLTWTATEGATWLSLLPTSGTVPSGESVEVVATFNSTGLLPDVYQADITITSNDPNTPEITLPATLTVMATSDLSIAKTAGSEPVKVGEVFTYTLVVENAGPDDATGVMVTDELPTLVAFERASEGCLLEAGVVTCTVGDLAAEGSVTLTITVHAVDVGIAENTAEVTSDSTDPNPDNNISTVDTTINPAILYFYLPIVQKH